MGGCARRSPRCLITPNSTTARRWWWRTWTSRRARFRARDPRPWQTGKASAPHRGRYPHPPVSGSAGCDGGAAPHRGDRRGPRLHQPLWGAQHWRKPLQQQTSDQSTVTVHHGAAAAIGRRGLGVAIRRRPAGPRNSGQRTAAGTPPTRPDHHPSATPRRHGSSGPPPPTRWVRVHRKTPSASGQHRSGRTHAGLTPAH